MQLSLNERECFYPRPCQTTAHILLWSNVYFSLKYLFLYKIIITTTTIINSEKKL